MSLHNLVLKKDMKLASNLYSCALSCLNRVNLELERNDLDEAMRWDKEFRRCMNELNELLEKKRKVDQRREYLQSLQKNGHTIATVFKEELG